MGTLKGGSPFPAGKKRAGFILSYFASDLKNHVLEGVRGLVFFLVPPLEFY